MLSDKSDQHLLLLLLLLLVSFLPFGKMQAMLLSDGKLFFATRRRLYLEYQQFRDLSRVKRLWVKLRGFRRLKSLETLVDTMDFGRVQRLMSS